MITVRTWVEQTLKALQMLDEVGGRIDEAVSKDAETQDEHDRVRRVLFELRAQLAEAYTGRLLSQIDHLDARLQALADQPLAKPAPLNPADLLSEICQRLSVEHPSRTTERSPS